MTMMTMVQEQVEEQTQDVTGDDAGTVAGDSVGVDRVGVDRDGAEVLAARLMAAAADLARQEAVFLELLGSFDASGAVRWWYEDASLASWVSRMCGIAPGTAREHVRVARGLQRMPQTAAAFRAGDLSYSKVRELTRLVDGHDEVAMLELARHATASQLARTVQAYRAHTGTHALREAKASVSWSTRDDGLVRITAVLTPEHGAVVVAALEQAADAHLDDSTTDQTDDDGSVGPVERVRVPFDVAETPHDRIRRSRVDGLVEIANHWISSSPEDRSGEDRTTVLVEVNATHLVNHHPHDDVERGESGQGDNVPAGTPPPHDTDHGATPTEAGGKCWIRGFGSLEPATARRLCCHSEVQAIITGLDGEPLHVGRTRRYATRAQRRALMLRDGHCAFPTCTRTRRLKVHHIIHWLDGGPTDLDNLMLLCQHHHTQVHEHGLTITTNHDTTNHDTAGSDDGRWCLPRWVFSRPDGSPIVPVHDLNDPDTVPPMVDAKGSYLTGPARDAALAERRRLFAERRRHRDAHLARQAALVDRYAEITSLHDPRAQHTIPIGGGEGFNLANCVDALFTARQPPAQLTTDRAA